MEEYFGHDALFPEEVQSFPDIFSARLGQGPSTMPEVERKPGNYLGSYPNRLAPPLDSLCQSPADFKSEVNDHGFPLLKLQDVFDDAADTQSGRSLIRSTAIALIVLKKMEASGNSGRMPADGLGVKKDFEPRAPKDLVRPHSGFYTGGKPLKDRGGSGVNAAC